MQGDEGKRQRDEGELEGRESERERRGELDLKWPALYALTVALEVPAMLARYVAGLVVAGVALRVSGHSADSAAEWGKLAAIGPVAWSALALVNPKGAGRWWRQRLGGREPSGREREVYANAIEELRAGTTLPLPSPESWFVVDEPRCEAAVCGDTMMLSRGLLESRHVAAVTAHGLGHLAGMDGRLTAALNRLTLEPVKLTRPPTPDPEEARRQTRTGGPAVTVASRKAEQTIATVGAMRWALGMAVALMRGGLGLRMTAAMWGAVWREQEYAADRWAAEIGQGEALAEFLESDVLELDRPIPLVSLTARTSPPTELRIERLRESARRQGPRAADSAEGPAWLGEPA